MQILLFDLLGRSLYTFEYPEIVGASNRYLIYTSSLVEYYVIYDFSLRKLRDRPKFMKQERGSFVGYSWYRNTQLILYMENTNLFYLWDIETDRVHLVKFEVSN